LRKKIKISSNQTVLGDVGICPWWKIMVNRIQYDGGSIFPTLQSPSQVSAELGPSPVPSDADILGLAVPGVSKNYGLGANQGQQPSKHDYTIAKIKMYNASLADIQARQQELQKLRSRLMSGYKHLLDQSSPQQSADASVSKSSTMAAANSNILQPHVKLLGENLSSNPVNSTNSVETTTQLDMNQKEMLNRIARAIDRVDKIQSQLQGDGGKTSEMLALTTSLDGLTNVQTAVGGADYSSKSANILVDQIMQNVASAVASHGSITSQAVQLALM